MEKQKKRRGDRKDGRLLRELDSLHFITGIIYPNRCDNEAYISLRVDLTAMNEYLAKANETETDFPYTMFPSHRGGPSQDHHPAAQAEPLHRQQQLLPAQRGIRRLRGEKAVLRQGRRGAGLPAQQGGLHRGRTYTSTSAAQVTGVPQRKGRLLHREYGYSQQAPPAGWARPPSSSSCGWISTAGCRQDMVATDPYYSSVVLSNLGSIKLKCGYHHLTNWGTCSLFCIIGEKKLCGPLRRCQRQRHHAGDAGPGPDHRRAAGRRVLLLQVGAAAEIPAGASLKNWKSL